MRCRPPRRSPTRPHAPALAGQPCSLAAVTAGEDLAQPGPREEEREHVASEGEHHQRDLFGGLRLGEGGEIDREADPLPGADADAEDEVGHDEQDAGHLVHGGAVEPEHLQHRPRHEEPIRELHARERDRTVDRAIA
eukprot:scaffold46778_cov57-Phaeocystis_antarctica.AAC.3